MPKIPGISHLRPVKALERAGFRIARQGKHIVMTDGRRIVTIPNALTMGGIVQDAGLTHRRNSASFSSSDLKGANFGRQDHE